MEAPGQLPSLPPSPLNPALDREQSPQKIHTYAIHCQLTSLRQLSPLSTFRRLLERVLLPHRGGGVPKLSG